MERAPDIYKGIRKSELEEAVVSAAPLLRMDSLAKNVSRHKTIKAMYYYYYYYY
jgi:hypothetical protein